MGQIGNADTEQAEGAAYAVGEQFVYALRAQVEGGYGRVVKPGQEVAAHEHSTSDDIWICLSGAGVFFPEPCEELEIRAGDVMVSRPGQCHGMRNTGDEDFVFVSIVAPAPSDFHPIECDCD